MPIKRVSGRYLWRMKRRQQVREHELMERGKLPPDAGFFLRGRMKDIRVTWPDVSLRDDPTNVLSSPMKRKRIQRRRVSPSESRPGKRPPSVRRRADRVFAVLGYAKLTGDRELVGLYSTRELAQAVIEAQSKYLRLTLRIEEVVLDAYPSAEAWRKPRPQAVAVAEIEAHVARIVRESGNVDAFDAKAWVRSWLTRPLAALGGKQPRQLLQYKEGRRRLHEIIGRMQSGAYS